MNPHEPAIAASPAVRSRLRIAAAIIAGVVVLGAAGVAGAWYFTRCGNCGSSPILCTDPCELPTFG